MKLTNKQIKKIIKEEIKNVMQETMISPSDLYIEILEDSKVDSKIKNLLKTALEEKNFKNAKMALEMIGTLYPEYSQVLGMDPVIFTSQYKSGFDDTTERDRKHGVAEKLKDVIRDIASPYNVPDLQVKGYYKRAFNRGQKYYAFVRSSDQQAMQKIVNDLKNAGYNPMDIIFEPKTKMYRFDILFLEHS